MKRGACWLTGTILFAFLSLVALPAQATDAVAHHRLAFVSHGKTIRVDEFAPTSVGPHPGALVLHGAGGMFFDGPEMRRVARGLAQCGIRAEVVHYFDGSGVVFTSKTETLQAHFAEWLGVVRDAAGWTQARAGATRQQPVAVYGYSMGAFLGIAVSSDNHQVGALVEQAGGVWDGKMSRLGRMPPVLMIHGRDDRRVPFDKFALPLETALKQRGSGCETLFFDHEGHGLSPTAQARARETTAKFIRRRLAAENPASSTTRPDRQPGGGTN